MAKIKGWKRYGRARLKSARMTKICPNGKNEIAQTTNMCDSDNQDIFYDKESVPIGFFSLILYDEIRKENWKCI